MGQALNMESFGRFQLVRRFARGGMAEVFLARQEGPGGFSRELVIKRVLPDLVDDPHFVELFLDEARLAAQLSHPNIVPIFDFGEVDGSYFIAMELVNGPSLRDLARAALKTGTPVSYALLARICSEIAKALTYVHNYQDSEGRKLKIVHRDISPSNIVISADGVPKLLDFGVARAAQSLHHTRTGEVKGKLPYMAPEQLSGEAEPDGRLDIYALGVVLYEMSTGRRPFNGDNDYALMLKILDENEAPMPHSFQSNYPEQLEKIVMKAITKDSAQRFQTAQEMARALEAFLFAGGQPVTNFELAEKIADCENVTGEYLRPVPPSVSIVPAEMSAIVPEMPRSRHIVAKDSVSAQPGLSREQTKQLPNEPEATRLESRSQQPAFLAGDSAGVNSEQIDMTGTGTLLRRNARPKKLKMALAILLLLVLAGFVGHAYWQAFAAKRQAEQDIAAADLSAKSAKLKEQKNTPEQASPRQGRKDSEVLNNKTVLAGKEAEQTKPHILAKPQVPVKEAAEAKNASNLRRHKKQRTKPKKRTKHKAPKVSPRPERSVDLGPGVLTVLVKPWADIYIDGVKKGTSPLAPISLKPGAHLLEARNPKFAAKKQKIQIESAQTKTVRIIFR